MKTTLKIIGMTCGHCVKGVTGALERTPGVGSVKVDLNQGIAEIDHDESVSTSELILPVHAEGYTAELR